MTVGHFYLTNTDSNNLINKREITKTEFDSHFNDSKILHEYFYYQRRLNIINLNKSEFTNNRNYYLLIFEKSQRQEINFDYKEEAFIELNRCLINFCASIVSIIEHCSNKVKELFTEDSNEFRNFEQFRRNRHSNSLSYQLLYAMRNYAIHDNFPISKVEFYRRNLRSCFVTPYFSKTDIIQSNFFKNYTKKSIESFEELFDVSPYIEHIIPIIESILKEFITIAKNSFIESANRLIALAEKEKDDNLGLTTVEYKSGNIEHVTKMLMINKARELISFIDD